MKRSALFLISFVSILILSFFVYSVTVNAETGELSEELNARLNGSISLFISSNKACVNGELKSIDTGDDTVVPLIKNSRTLLPLRFIVENFGATVNWDQATSTVEVSFGDKTAKLKLGDNRMTVNGTEFILDAKAESISSRTFIPLRSLAENLLDKKVFYSKGLIVISDKENIFDENKDTDLINEISSLIGSPLFLIKQNGKFGYIDRNGKIVIKPQYEYAGFFSEGLAYVMMDGKYGYINRAGELAIDVIFKNANDFKEGLAAVKATEDNTSKWGFINKKGEFVIKPRFETVESFKDGMAVFEKDNMSGCIDKNGNVVVESKYDDMNDFSEGLARISINDKYGFINKRGNIVIEPVFEYVGSFHEGLAQASIEDKCGYINITGKFVIEPKFEFTADFSEGLACVEINDKFGFIDKTGKFVIQPGFEFEEFWSTFNDGMAIIQDITGEDGYRYGFIDKTGKVVIKPSFEITWGFDNGLAIVMENEGFEKDGKIGYIDKSGKFVWKLQE